MAATSTSGAWAVGDDLSGGGYRTLILKWNGRIWRQLPSPSPSATDNVLTGVAATSARSAWALGYEISRGGYRSLILSWNGHSWKQVPSPSPSGIDNFLTGVAATSARSAWAVGYYFGGSTYRTLILRWNGHAWKRAASPDAGASTRFNELTSVTAIPSGNAWAGGYYFDGTADQTLIEHWTGSSWKLAATPDLRGSSALNVLAAVGASSTGKAWAVGHYYNGAASQTLALRCG